MLGSPLSTAVEAVEPASAVIMPTAAAAAPAAGLSFLNPSAASGAQQQQDLTDQQQQAAEPQGALAPHQRELQLVLQLNNTEAIQNDMMHVHSELLGFLQSVKRGKERCRQQVSTVLPGAEAGQSVTAPASQQMEKGAAATADEYWHAATAANAVLAAPAADVSMLSTAASAAQQEQQHTIYQQQQAAEGLGISGPLQTHQHMRFMLQLGQQCSDASLHTLSKVQQLAQYMQQREEVP